MTGSLLLSAGSKLLGTGVCACVSGVPAWWGHKGVWLLCGRFADAEAGVLRDSQIPKLPPPLLTPNGSRNCMKMGNGAPAFEGLVTKQARQTYEGRPPGVQPGHVKRRGTDGWTLSHGRGRSRRFRDNGITVSTAELSAAAERPAGPERGASGTRS